MRGPARVAGVLAVVLLLSACVRMPTDGPVTEVQTSTEVSSPPGIGFDPRPPQPGESAVEIVAHFLEAMKATPITTSVARQFLSQDAQQSWQPDDAIVTYGELGDPVGGDLTVQVPMSSINVYDDRGAWQRSRDGVTMEFSLTSEDGEWRISEVPDALVVPESWFETLYRRASLYLFDPTAGILVPEPVYVPEGEQVASALVPGLLPHEGTDPRVARTFFPPGFSTSGPVPITSAGIAEVSLDGDPEAVDEVVGQLMLTQLIWTLRQEPRIRAVQLTIGDRELGLPGGATQVDLDVGSAYDPTGAQSTGDVFGLVDGRVVRGAASSLLATSGPMGTERLGIRSIGVNLEGSRVAGVSGDGTGVLVAPVDDEEGTAVQVVSGAGDLLPPAWDFADRMWLLDRAGGRAQVLVVTGTRARSVQVPGVSGRDVEQLLVSRDGSRLVAVVAGADGDRVVAARVLHGDAGRVLGATRARRLAYQPDASGQVRDIAWRTPTTVSVLSDITDDLSQVRTVSVDGAPGEVVTSGSSRVRGAFRHLVGSPVEGAEVYVVAGREIIDLTAPTRPLSALPAGLTSLTYAG
ncbi:GerMN domain-containing protein [Nocardioides sediminis]|uniref:GerMN domain-containing protein n=1 Tax=Nocardioides sediminis TaxID=433648 RepID=UPI000D324AFF|nr:GerMN domain-containing protein [Nocardioides sediminis]